MSDATRDLIKRLRQAEDRLDIDAHTRNLLWQAAYVLENIQDELDRRGIK